MLATFSTYKREDKINYLLDKYSGLMSDYAYNYLKNMQEAEDVVQEIFIRIWQNRNIVLEDEKSAKTYLFNSVRNSCIDILRKNHSIIYNSDIINMEILDEEINYYEEEIINKIIELIQKMPPQTQRIINGIFFRNMKYQEIANELDISINTIKTLLRKGLKQLRENIKQPLENILFIFIKFKLIKARK